MKENRVGKIYEGRWEIISYIYYPGTTKNKKFVLKNIFNDEIITLTDRTIRKIERGETTLSKILHNKIVSSKKYKRRETFKDEK